MTEESEATPVDEDDLQPVSAKMLYQLSGMVRGYARDSMRVRTLVTFKDRLRGNGDFFNTKFKSKVKWSDRPEIELYLMYRDECVKIDGWLERHTETLEKAAKESGDPLAITQAMNTIANLQRSKASLMEKMQVLLQTLQKEFAGKETTMAKLASDGAKLAMAAQMHRDRIKLARKNADDPSEDELLKITNA